MADWLFYSVVFGVGPAMALGLLGLARWNRHRDDVDAWERGQALRRQLREQSVLAPSPSPHEVQPPAKEGSNHD